MDTGLPLQIWPFSPQGLPACGQASKALKETRGNLGPLESLATWAFLDPVAPWGSLASQDRKASRATQETSRTSHGRPSQP